MPDARTAGAFRNLAAAARRLAEREAARGNWHAATYFEELATVAEHRAVLAETPAESPHSY